MSIKSNVTAVALAALVVTGGVASTATPAHAGGGGGNPGWGWGVGAGLVGAAIVGSAIAASNPSPYYYQRSCWVRQFDAYGNYLGRVNTCY